MSKDSINFKIKILVSNININDYINKRSVFKKMKESDFEKLVPILAEKLEDIGFDVLLKKYNNITEDDYLNDWNKFKKWTTDKNIISAQTQRGMKIIKMVMVHIYDVQNHKGFSIKNLWNKKFIQKALRVNRKTHSTPYFSEIVRQVGFTAGTSKVTIYRPTLTKRIVEACNAKSVLDVCVGWGGRMLGSCVVEGCSYTGIEPSTKTYEGLVKMKDLLGLETATLYNGKAEDKLVDIPNNSFDLALTSPPYYNLEIYTDEESQSHHYGSYSDWVEKFLKPVVYGVTDKVKDNGTICWSVKNFKTDEKCNLYDDVVRLNKDKGWILTTDEFKVGSSARPGAGSKKKAKSVEITYVFKKSEKVWPSSFSEDVSIPKNIEMEEVIVNNTESTTNEEIKSSEIVANDIVVSNEHKLILKGDIHKLENLFKNAKSRLKENNYPPESEYSITSDIDKALISGLTSKSSNDLYEEDMCSILDVTHVPEKHGWDALDNKETDNIEIYEFKPTKTKTGSCSINDDTPEKINKSKNCEISINPFGRDKKHKCSRGWVVIARINKETCAYRDIYKFPLEIYNEDRLNYFNKLREKNKNQNKQTRVTYSISISKSIKLCKKYNKKYYKWGL